MPLAGFVNFKLSDKAVEMFLSEAKQASTHKNSKHVITKKEEGPAQVDEKDT